MNPQKHGMGFVAAQKTAQAAQDAWKADPTFHAARGALATQLNQYGNNLATQANRYDSQYGEDLGNLGLQYSNGARYVTPDKGAWSWADRSKPNSSTIGGDLNRPGASAGSAHNWNQIDTNTSSGRAFTDLRNDYAARGDTQSSGYLHEMNQTGSNFAQQVQDASTARNQYLSDLGQQKNTYVGQQNDQLNQARIAATNAFNNQQQTNAVRQAAGLGKA